MKFSGEQYKGKFKKKNILASKSAFVNTLLMTQKELNKIEKNTLEILGTAKEVKKNFLQGSYIKKLDKLYSKLPKNHRLLSKWRLQCRK